jgi:hypothetical protein
MSLGLALTHVFGVGCASPVQWSPGPQSRGRSGGRPSLMLAANWGRRSDDGEDDEFDADFGLQIEPEQLCCSLR